MNVKEIIAQWSVNPQTLNLARKHLQQPEQAHDAIHEAVLSALENLDPEHPEPLAWLHLTLKRRCWETNRILRSRREKTYDQAVSRQSLEQLVSCDELLEELWDLRPDERSTLLDICLAGWSYEEIARRRGWTYTKVNRCAAEGRQRLRALVERKELETRGGLAT